MFSNLSQNSILYVLDINNTPKVLSGPVDRVYNLRPRYRGFNPNMEMIIDVEATIGGERREFKGIPNSTIANFGEFVLADSKESLESYINAMLQNSLSIVNGYEKHKDLSEKYEEAKLELNPNLKNDKEKDKAILSLLSEISELKSMILSMTKLETQTK